MYPLVTRPTEVEWVEMDYDRGPSDPTVQIADMKKKPDWEDDKVKTSVEIIPIKTAEDSRRPSLGGPSGRAFRPSPTLLDRPRGLDVAKELSAMVVPVNVISITPGKTSTFLNITI